jgi:secondary thiamine-phosphate synthase enzyme
METAQLDLSTSRRTQFVPVTGPIAGVIAKNGWRDGVLTIFVPHTTAAVTINENADPDVAADMESFSDQLIPQSRHFRHAEGNSDAHIKASLFGASLQVIVRGGAIWLGTWQGIYFCEFDGPRQRTLFMAFS